MIFLIFIPCHTIALALVDWSIARRRSVARKSVARKSVARRSIARSVDGRGCYITVW